MTHSIPTRRDADLEIYDEGVERVADRLRVLRTGPQSRNPDCGPVINQKQYRRIRTFIEEAVGSGARIAAQGALAADLPSGGFYIPPTLFADLPRNHEQIGRASRRERVCQYV